MFLPDCAVRFYGRTNLVTLVQEYLSDPFTVPRHQSENQRGVGPIIVETQRFYFMPRNVLVLLTGLLPRKFSFSRSDPFWRKNREVYPFFGEAPIC